MFVDEYDMELKKLRKRMILKKNAPGDAPGNREEGLKKLSNSFQCLKDWKELESFIDDWSLKKRTLRVGMQMHLIIS